MLDLFQCWLHSIFSTCTIFRLSIQSYGNQPASRRLWRKRLWAELFQKCLCYIVLRFLLFREHSGLAVSMLAFWGWGFNTWPCPEAVEFFMFSRGFLAVLWFPSPFQRHCCRMISITKSSVVCGMVWFPGQGVPHLIPQMLRYRLQVLCVE